MKWLGWYFKINLLVRILLGLILGAIAGLVFGPGIVWVSPFGDIFVRLLKMIVMPVVMFTLIVGAASIHPAWLGRVGVKALVLYMITTAFAVVLGLIMGNIFHPGQGLQLAGAASAFGKELEQPSLLDTLINVVPKNPFSAFATGEILPTIFFCIIFGIGLAFLRESGEERIREAANVVFKFVEGCGEIMYKVVHWILQYAPIGVFALIAVVFGKQGAEAFGPLGNVAMSVYIALLVHYLLVYGGLLAIFRISPRQFYTRAKEATITAFVTRSSGGTLPVTLDVAQNKMDGTAIYQGVCAIFVGFAMIFGIDALLDMGRTALNVTGDLAIQR